MREAGIRAVRQVEWLNIRCARRGLSQSPGEFTTQTTDGRRRVGVGAGVRRGSAGGGVAGVVAVGGIDEPTTIPMVPAIPN